MSTTIIILVAIIGLAGLAAVGYVVLAAGSKPKNRDVRGLMGASANRNSEAGVERSGVDLDELKTRTRGKKSKKKAEDINTKLFRAGYFTAADRKAFLRLQIIAPVITTPLCAAMMFMMGKPMLVTVGFLLGAFIGFAMPLSILERQVRRRQEDTMYYLPLVIEQISIGVSSSLDVGPCIAHIVTMARERKSHNPITEMFVHAEKLIRSGMSLEEALLEVSEVNGQNEVRHAFMFLAQCARHGGELSKQLQELADAVMMQRQVQIEAKITTLPVKATGPLATVFAGFFGVLLAGLLVRLMSAFQN